MSVQVPAARCDALLTKVGTLVVFRNTCIKISNRSVETQASIPAEVHLEIIKGVVHMKRVFAMVLHSTALLFHSFFLFKVLDGHLSPLLSCHASLQHLADDNCFLKSV